MTRLFKKKDGVKSKTIDNDTILLELPNTIKSKIVNHDNV